MDAGARTMRGRLLSAMFLVSFCAVAGCQSPKGDASSKAIDGDYEKIDTVPGSRTVTELHIRGSAIAYKSTTVINGKYESIYLSKFRLRRIRDDFYMLSEESSDSYGIDEKGKPDRSLGWKIEAPKTNFKTIRATGDGGIAERMAAVLLGANPHIEGRWAWKYDYGKGSASKPESTVLEIGDKKVKSRFSMKEEIVERPAAISGDTLSVYGEAGKILYAEKYRISNDTLFMEILAPAIEYRRRVHEATGSDFAK